MIVHGDIYETFIRERISNLGYTDDNFYSLPYEFQKALITSGLERKMYRQNLIELRKKIALRQYLFEENVKEKVLMLFKKNK